MSGVQREDAVGGYDRKRGLRLLSHDLLVLIADDLLTVALRDCRYCGIGPDQEFPRPSYPEMRQRLAEATDLLQRARDDDPTSQLAEDIDAFKARQFGRQLQDAGHPPAVNLCPGSNLPLVADGCPRCGRPLAEPRPHKELE